MISCSHDKQGTWRKVDSRRRVDWVRIRVSLGLGLGLRLPVVLLLEVGLGGLERPLVDCL